MIIQSSSVQMGSARSYASSKRSISSLTTWGNGGALNSGMLLKGTIGNAQTSASGKQSKDDNKQEDFASSVEDLMARFSASRSTRAASAAAKRSAFTIRRASIGYLLHQLFWGNKKGFNLSQFFEPQNNMQTQEFGGQLRYSTSYSEYEETSFSTTGKVVTASGQEIEFNLELQMSRSFYESVSGVVDFGAPKLTDPLVINLDTDVATVEDQKFYFDLDCDGHAEEISRLNSGSGYLALDKNGDGIINDGSELFGTTSGNGFADLAQYDSDGNGWIDEADEIFDKLLIWRKDENGNDVLCGLGQAGIGAIYLGSADTEFSLNSQHDNHTNGVIRRTGIFIYENGMTGTVQQLDLAR